LRPDPRDRAVPTPNRPALELLRQCGCRLPELLHAVLRLPSAVTVAFRPSELARPQRGPDELDLRSHVRVIEARDALADKLEAGAREEPSHDGSVLQRDRVVRNVRGEHGNVELVQRPSLG
jgi:hypothetical protein